MDNPNVFISWSGDRSRSVAGALRDWLPTVLQSAEPWMSSTDLHAGRSWQNELRIQLDGCIAGIACVTREDFQAPWMMFEAGALARQVNVCLVPYLLDLDPADLTGPLTMFQAVRADDLGTWHLLRAINAAFQKGAVRENHLESAYRRGWPELHLALERIRATEPSHTPGEPIRPQQDVLREILMICRRIVVVSGTSPANIAELADTMDTETQRTLMKKLKELLTDSRPSTEL